jgi:hypothetical protein
MAYKFYMLTRYNATSGALTTDKIVFNDAPPTVEGVYNAPRQNFKLQEMEVGSVNLDYGPDPGNQVIVLTIPSVPECLMAYWLQEAGKPDAINATYEFKDHRGKALKVKWKDFRVEFVRTLPAEDVDFWYEYYQAMMEDLDAPLLSDLSSTADYAQSDIADLYKVVIELTVVADPLFPLLVNP